VPDREPAQILVGLTRMGETDATRLLQQRWRDGAFTEIAQWPAACATQLLGLEPWSATELLGLAKLVVPYGGLKRAKLAGGQTIIINGATGYFGSGAVMTALALGAGRVVAVGRNADALAALSAAFGARVVPAVVSGSAEQDPAIIRAAAGGAAHVALDLLGNATSTSTTLSCLRALARGGRLVLMGSATVPLEISFRELLANDWEVVGQFMYERTAPAELAALVALGLLDLRKIRVAAFALAQLPDAIAAASRMQGLDLTAVVP
jgi:alcohol dehydrogenase